jgi:hypothetical protein
MRTINSSGGKTVPRPEHGRRPRFPETGATARLKDEGMLEKAAAHEEALRSPAGPVSLNEVARIMN